MRVIAAFLLFTSTALAQDRPGASPNAMPARTQSAPLETLRSTERQKLVQSISNLSPLPPCKLADALKLSLREGLIDAESPMRNTDGVHRIDLTDLPGVGQFNAGEDNRNGSRWIDFQHSDFTTPGAVVTMLQVFLRDDYLQIAYDFTGPLENVRVQLIQAPRLAENGDSPNEVVKLYIERYDGTGDELVARHRCSAVTFEALLRENRAAVLKYVMAPLASRKLQRAILATPTESAWLVLNESAPPPEIAGRVDGLVKKLDSEVFADRRAAAEELSKLGPPGAMALRRVDRSVLSEEQRQAIETVLAGYSDLSDADRARLGNDPLFLIGVLYSDEKALWPTAFQRLMKWRAVATSVSPTNDADDVRELADAWMRLLISEIPATQPTTAPAE